MNVHPSQEVIPAQRRAMILDIVRTRGAISIRDLAQAMGTSASTVRRDLEHLQASGYLRRAHGGALIACAPLSTFEPAQSVSAGLARAQKRAIGQAAAALLTPGEAVVFDSSSTVLEAAKAVVERRIVLTAVTNDLAIGEILTRASEIRVIVTGGTIRPGSLTLTGEPGLGFLAGLHIETALIGVHAICDGLLTETSLEIAAMKRTMIASARRVVVLADATKFQPMAFCTIADAAVVDHLITDATADKHALERLRELGVTVTQAGAPE